MQELYWIGLEWIMCVVELVIFHIFMSRHCEKRKIGYIGKVFIFVGISTLLYAKGYWQIFDLIKVLICVLILATYGIASFKTKKYMYFIYAGIYVLLVALSDMMCASIAGMLLPDMRIDDLLKVHGIRYLVGVISKVCILCLVFGVSNKNERESKNYSRTNIGILLLVFLISIICLYSLLVVKQSHYNNHVNNQIDILICLISLSIFFIDMIIYWAIRQLNVKLNKEKEYELIQCQNELLTKAVIEHKEAEKEWHKNRHDFNNHISCIDMLLQMENTPKARGYIQKLTNNWDKNDFNIDTGNEIASAVINQKAIQAKSLKIEFLVSGQIDERLNIEDMDLCALLSNSLDNAIEATKQVPEIKNRKIEIVFSHKNKNMVIEVKNSVKENIETKEQLATTKKDRRRHGIGMMSMQMTASKYGGLLKWQCEDYEFQLNIELPI